MSKKSKASPRMSVTFEFYAPEDWSEPIADVESRYAVGEPLGKPVAKKELADYISEALESWGGQRRPADPLFDGITPLKLKLRRV